MVSRGMIKEKKTPLKPKVKSFKVKVSRVKSDVMKIMLEDQRIAGDVNFQCHELRLETEVIVDESSSDCIRLGIVFNIVGGGDQDGDVEMAADLGSFPFPRSVSDKKRKL